MLLMALVLVITPMRIGAQVSDVNKNTDMDSTQIKKLLDRQTLQTLGLLFQPTGIISTINFATSSDSVHLSYNATINSAGQHYQVSENILQTAGIQENHTTFSESISGNNKTYALNVHGESKSTIAGDKVVNSVKLDFAQLNNTITKSMNATIDYTKNLDSTKTLFSKTEVTQNISGLSVKSVAIPISSGLPLPSPEQSIRMTTRYENGTLSSTDFTVSPSLPLDKDYEKTTAIQDQTLHTLDSRDLIYPTYSGILTPNAGTVCGHTWFSCGAYIYWDDVFNGQIDIASYISGICIGVITALAEAMASFLVGLGFTISLGAILATGGPLIAMCLLVIPAVIAVAEGFPADLGGEYDDMSILYFEFACVQLVGSLILPAYGEVGFCSNYYKYPGELKTACPWTYFDAFDSNTFFFGSFYDLVTGNNNHQSTFPADLPSLLDPYVTINSYDESNTCSFNGIPITIDGFSTGETSTTVFIPPGDWTIDFPSTGLDYIDIDGSPVYDSSATFSTVEGYDFTITANYYYPPPCSIHMLLYCWGGLYYDYYDYYAGNTYQTIDPPYVGIPCVGAYLDGNPVDTSVYLWCGTCETHTIEFDYWS